MRTLRWVFAALVPLTALAALTPARAAVAQVPGTELTRVLVSRQDLQDLLARLEQAAESRTFTTEVRNRARAEAARVRQRLQDGDFQVGDRILLKVEGESLFSDTVSVRAGRTLQLPVVGDIPLQGVLRVELTDHLTQKLAQFLRNPKVRAQSLIRIAVLGGVAKQGFYTLPVDIPVNEVLNSAGGVLQTADLDKFRIERGHERLYDGDQLQQAISEGRTLDALSIQAGDRFVVPVIAPRNLGQTLQAVNVAVLALFSLSRLLSALGL